jgi:ferritin-like protein
MAASMRPGHWTRGDLLRGAAAAGAAVGAGALLGSGAGGGAPFAATSPDTDAKLLNAFLTLERMQEAFYRVALERADLSGELLEFARAAADQEAAHVKFLTERLGSRAAAAPKSDFGSALSSADAFRSTAIRLEESALATYIGQAANLSRALLSPIAALTSVEARQAAWIRDIAGTSPAPRAADPARKAEDVLADLRNRGYIA